MIDWLADSDPALRWQVQRDLLGLPVSVWRATRARVASEGWGAALLAHQDSDGQWAGGAFFPAGDDETEDGQPWTATTWTLNSLREWGLDAAVLAGTAQQLATHSRWEYDGSPYWQGEVDCCINAYTLSNGLWLGADVAGLVDWFLEHQLPDGGWNCEWVEGSTRSSFHSTLNTLRGLLDAQRATPQATPAAVRLREARGRGEEYLLARRLHRRLSDGEPHGDWALHFAYPFRWVYSVLKAADYFRAAAAVDDRPPDPRLAEAIAIIRAARDSDGRWSQAGHYPGRVWFEVDAPIGEPSRWLTFFAVRVLDWWDGAALESR